MKTTINTGALELRELYQRYVTEGLMLAGLFHLTLIGGYQIYTNITESGIEFPNRYPPKTLYVLPPPPSLIARPTLQVYTPLILNDSSQIAIGSSTVSGSRVPANPIYPIAQALRGNRSAPKSRAK